MSHSKNSRRTFLKSLALGAASLPIIDSFARPSVGLAQAAAPATPTKALDENDPMAKALGYYHDASKVDVAKWPKKAASDGANQNCKNCVLWVQGGLKAEGKDGEWGKCGLFANGLVAAGGWCNSWAKKA